MAEKTRLDVPRLKGWWTLTQAADHLGISRWAAHKMVEAWTKYRDAEVAAGRTPAPEGLVTTMITTCQSVGDPTRPVYLVREAEIKNLKRDRGKERLPLRHSA